MDPGKGVAPSLHFGVVAIEKRAFKLPLTMVANLLSIIIKMMMLLSDQYLNNINSALLFKG